MSSEYIYVTFVGVKLFLKYAALPVEVTLNRNYPR
jgi:hypothetical protein